MYGSNRTEGEKKPIDANGALISKIQLVFFFVDLSYYDFFQHEMFVCLFVSLFVFPFNCPSPPHTKKLNCARTESNGIEWNRMESNRTEGKNRSMRTMWWRRRRRRIARSPPRPLFYRVRPWTRTPTGDERLSWST